MPERQEDACSAFNGDQTEIGLKWGIMYSIVFSLVPPVELFAVSIKFAVSIYIFD
jgi:hypothetical protein